MSQKTPLVSIITPVYNGEKFIAQAIESILGQSYSNIEYIVIDDGSTDNSFDVAAKYGKQLTLFKQANSGQAKTLNRGWEISKGQLLGYLSADDILLPNAIDELVQLLTNNSRAVVAYPNCDLIDPYGRIIKRAVARPFDLDSLVVEQECYIGPGALFRREIFEKLGGWNPNLRLAPDREFWMRAGLKGGFVMHPKILAHYRMHENSISYFQTDKKAAEEYVEVIKEYYQRSDLPQTILSKRNIAYSKAHIVSARIHLRGGRIKHCYKQLKLAIKFDPHFNKANTAWMLLRTVVSRTIRKITWIARRLFGQV